MKIRKLFLSLVLSGVSLVSAAAQQPIQDPAPAKAPASRNASRHIGDAVPAVAESGGPSSLRMAQYSAGMQQIAPTATGFQQNMPSYDMSPYGSGYGENTYTNSCGPTCASGCDRSSDMWFGAETLLWWGQKRNTPPLLTTSGQGVLPVAGAPGVTTVVGGSEAQLDSGLLPGYRLSGGMYFGPEKRFGISGRLFGIYRDTNTITRSSDGTTSSIGLPFFNTLIDQPDAYLVAFNNGAPVASGSATVTNRLDLLSSDSSLRLLVCDSCDHHMDLLGGYTYLRLRDSVGISSTSTDTFTGNLIPDGTVFQTNDLFSAENRFHGGHLGLQNTVKRNRVSLTTLSKVSFGSMQQSGFINGSTAVGMPPATPTVTPGGIYTQQSNIGTYSRDTFAFIPELGIKGGLAIRENVSLTAGYTFLYVSKLALAGDQIDYNVDLSQAQGGAPAQQPAFSFREGSMWFQGLDLGVNFTF